MLKLPTLSQWDRPDQVRIFLYTAPTDMRQGFDTLAQLIRTTLGEDPLSGSLFVFRSRGKDRLKILYWDSDGYALWYKRLEQGTWRFPRTPEGEPKCPIRPSELAMLLEGIDLRSIRRRPGYTRPPGA
jgi:transposase